MTLLIRLLSVLVISTSLFVAGCSSGGSSAGFDKEDTDGDGIADIYDPDIDGDGIPNGQDPDIDGDGIPNDQDPDMDGDSKPNGKDPDPENNDPNYCDRIQVFGLSDGQKTGEEIELTWEFWNSKVGSNGQCTMKDGVEAGLAQITASAVGATDEKSGETNPLDDNDEVTIKIPAACTGETVEVTYDFTEFATLIKADPNAPGWTVKQRHKADPERCDTDGDGFPDFGPAQCPTGATGTYPSCSCPDGEKYEAETNSCEVAAVACTEIGFEMTDLTTVSTQNYVYPEGCEFTAAQNNLDVGVNVTLYAQYTHGSAKTYVGPASDVTGKPNDFPITFDPLPFCDEFKLALEKREGKVDSVYIRYKQIQGLEAAANAVGLQITEPYSTKKYILPSLCGVESGDLLPLGSSDTDNDGIPNDADSDVDGDGIPNTSDNDIDGDGIWNKDDPDIDGDGKTNGIDPDADGDGTPDAEDDTPGGPQ